MCLWVVIREKVTKRDPSIVTTDHVTQTTIIEGEKRREVGKNREKVRQKQREMTDSKGESTKSGREMSEQAQKERE